MILIILAILASLALAAIVLCLWIGVSIGIGTITDHWHARRVRRIRRKLQRSGLV